MPKTWIFRVIGVALLSTGVVDVCSQTPSEPLVLRRYDEGPLTAGDFTGKVPLERGGRLAWTYSRIRYSFQYRGNISSKKAELIATQIESFAVMMPDKSWNVAPKDAALLDHEQGHFDITQLHAIHWRRHAEALIAKSKLVGEGETKEQALKNLQLRCDKELEGINAALDAEQVRYDRETNHGQDPARQAQWRQRLNNELAAVKSAAR